MIDYYSPISLAKQILNSFIRVAVFSLLIICSACTIFPTEWENPDAKNTPTYTPVANTVTAISPTLPDTMNETQISTIFPLPGPITTVDRSISQVCSPIAGVDLTNLKTLITNPYNPPRPGSDDPHQGIDLSVLDPGTNIAIPGTEVQAVLPGVVAAIIEDRYPYGNAIIIETPWEDIPLYLIKLLDTMEHEAEFQANPSLTCPQTETDLSWSNEQHSIYLLYAHLQNPPLRQIGDSIMCEEKLGQIGDSGNALNPHLHLEIRLGPQGARFPGMAHYDNSATALEMQMYCTWRVSGLFQHINPLWLLENNP